MGRGDGIHRGLVSHMTDSSLALNLLQVSSESPLDSLQNICSHAIGIWMTPGVALALFTTIWGKSADRDRERQTDVFITSQEHLEQTLHP